MFTFAVVRKETSNENDAAASQRGQRLSKLITRADQLTKAWLTKVSKQSFVELGDALKKSVAAVKVRSYTV
jgi:protein gp37